ncbi:MAG TPA: hypothetical protein VIF34_11825, partial [Methylocystis sp.]
MTPVAKRRLLRCYFASKTCAGASEKPAGCLRRKDAPIDFQQEREARDGPIANSRALSKNDRPDFRPAGVYFRRCQFDQGISPATNFGITGPPISAAKRLPSGEK